MNFVSADLLAPAQLTGYIVCAIGITTFLQKSDQRLRAMTCLHALVYALHYYLLGNFGATGSALVSSLRSGVSVFSRTRSLALAFLTINIGQGWYLAQGWAGWLPVIGTSIATLALFFLEGIAMRLAILMGTGLILTTNILSGSVGGTILELLIATANGITILRLVRLQRHPA